MEKGVGDKTNWKVIKKLSTICNWHSSLTIVEKYYEFEL